MARPGTLAKMKRNLMSLVTHKDAAEDEVSCIQTEMREHRPKDALSHYCEMEYITSQRLTAGCSATNVSLRYTEAVQQLRVRSDLELQKANIIANSYAERSQSSDSQVARARNNLETALVAATQDVGDAMLLLPCGPCVNCSID